MGQYEKDECLELVTRSWNSKATRKVILSKYFVRSEFPILTRRLIQKSSVGCVDEVKKRRVSSWCLRDSVRH